MTQTMRFSGKVVLVAGGTGGLGRAVSLAFLREGADVVVTYRKQDEFDALKFDANNALNKDAAHGWPRLTGERVDVTASLAAERLLHTIVERSGHLDALVNSVGGYVGGIKLWELNDDALEQMLARNLRSTYALARAAVPVMLRQGRGAIVNVAARAALAPPAGAGAYAASKAAAVAMLASLAAELSGTGVRVNSILPSIIDTAANRKAMPKADFSKWPKPEDIARVVLFLCSDDARVVHGAAIPVYGESP